MTAARIVSPYRVRDLAVLAAAGITLRVGDPHSPSDRATYHKRYETLRAAWRRQMTAYWTRQMRAEDAAVLKKASGADTPKALGREIEKAANKAYDFTDEYRRTYASIFPVFAERVFDSLAGDGKSIGSGLQLLADPELVQAWLASALEWVDEEGGDLITSVKTVSRGRVIVVTRRLVTRAIEDGWTMNRLTGALKAQLQADTDWRARRIARTEVGRAANLGSRAGAKTTGQDLNKEWLTGPPGTGDRHATTDYPDLDGQVKGLDELYQVAGPDGTFRAMYPLDTMLPASESVHCRCAETYFKK